MLLELTKQSWQISKCSCFVSMQNSITLPFFCLVCLLSRSAKFELVKFPTQDWSQRSNLVFRCIMSLLLSFLVLKLLIYFFVPKTYCDIPANSSWRSLIFAISNRNSYEYRSLYYNYLCIEKSSFYCLQGYVTNAQEYDYEYLDTAGAAYDNRTRWREQLIQIFEDMISPVYQRIALVRSMFIFQKAELLY